MKIIKNLYNRKVFIDTNAFIYFLTGTCNDSTKEIFKEGSLKKIKLITNTRVIDELLFKIMIIEAKTKFKIEKKVIQKLKENKNLVKELSSGCKKVVSFLRDLNVEIIEIKKEALFEIPELMEKFGLFGNDALILKIMKERNLKYLLTADKDFENIDWIKIINPKN